jgi:chorismate mutase
MTKETALQALAEHRHKIDDIDRRILALLNERTQVVQEIGKIKHGLALAIYEPKREDEVFRNVTGNNAGPLPAESVRRVFERIVDEMRTVQRDQMRETGAAAQAGVATEGERK